MGTSSAQIDETVAVVAEPAVNTEPELASSEDDWLCAWCLEAVAKNQHRFSYEGRDEFVFTNPEGIVFEIITFSRAGGCVQKGLTTLANTWFPGYAWSYALCAGCGQHLGWFYAGKDQFLGLIKDRLVRRLCLRN